MRAGNRKTRNPVVVAEAGKEQLKLIRMNRGGGGGEVTALYLRRYDPLDDASIREIATDLRKVGLTRGPVVGCLPRQAVNVRVIEVPSVDHAEIADMVELQIGKQTPYPREEIVADYRLMSSERKGYTRVMLMIAQRSLIRTRFRVLEEAGLEVEGLSLSSEGLLNWCRTQQGRSRGTSVVFEVDTSHTDMAVICSGELVFTKSILVGASHLENQAEGGKWRERLLHEAANSMEALTAEMQGMPPADKVMLTGARSVLGGLKDAIAERLGLSVTVTDAFAGLGKGSGLTGAEKGPMIGASFSSLTGMAMAPELLQFNLLPETVTTRRDLVAKARLLMSTGVLVMAIMAVGSAGSMAAIQKRVARLSWLKSALAVMVPEVTEIERKDATTRMIVGRMDNRNAPVQVLLKLHTLTPKEVWWDSLTIESDRGVTVKGYARALPVVDRFRGNLETFFEKVTAEEQTWVQDKFRFTFVCRMAGQQEGE